MEVIQLNMKHKRNHILDVIFCSGGIFDASSLLLWYKSTILHDFFPITNLRAEIGLENGAAVCSTPFQKMYFCVYGCVCWFFCNNVESGGGNLCNI